MTELLGFVGAWQNLPFTAMLAVCLLAGVLQLAGLGGGEDHGDHDAGHDGDHGAEHDADHDHDGDHGHEAGLDSDPGGPFSLLAFLGFGKAPLMVVLMLLLASIGISGWLMNALVARVLGQYPALALAAVLPLALLMGAFASSRLARGFARVLPPLVTSAQPMRALVGLRGHALGAIDPGRTGNVRVRDAGGNLISVYARVADGQSIARDSDVLLVNYDEAAKTFTVVGSK
jgi:hypothetical protein